MSLAKGVAASRSGGLADTVSPRLVLAGGWLLFALAYGALAAVDSLALALPLIIAVGVAYGVAEPAERALVAALAPTGTHGAAFGWYALVQGLMALPAGLLAGALWDHGPAGPSWAFGATALLATAASCALAALPLNRAGGSAGIAPPVMNS